MNIDLPARKIFVALIKSGEEPITAFDTAHTVSSALLTEEALDTLQQNEDTSAFISGTNEQPVVDTQPQKKPTKKITSSNSKIDYSALTPKMTISEIAKAFNFATSSQFTKKMIELGFIKKEKLKEVCPSSPTVKSTSRVTKEGKLNGITEYCHLKYESGKPAVFRMHWNGILLSEAFEALEIA